MLYLNVASNGKIFNKNCLSDSIMCFILVKMAKYTCKLLQLSNLLFILYILDRIAVKLSVILT